MPVEKRCRSCRARVLFVQLDTGAWMPVNADPDPIGGTVVLPMLPGDKARVVRDFEERQRLMRGGRSLYMSHFATCPYASRHRKLNPT